GPGPGPDPGPTHAPRPRGARGATGSGAACPSWAAPRSAGSCCARALSAAFALRSEPCLDGAGEGEPEPRLGWATEGGLDRQHGIVKQRARPGHVLDDTAIGDRRDQMHVNFRKQM